MTKSIEVNPFSDWINSKISKSDNPIVKSSSKMVEYFFELERSMKKYYGWRYYDLDAFEQLMKDGNTSLKANGIYWKDMGRQMEAYGVMLVFRTNEILRVAIKALNARKLTPSAILARSLLEISAVAIENSNTYLQTITSISKNDMVIQTSPDLEKLTIRNIWGTRFGDNIPEHIVQRNVLSTVDKVTKIPNASELRKRYDYLSEIAHPNHLGFAKFWSENGFNNNDGSVTIKIDKKNTANSNNELIVQIAWALCWTSTCVRNSFHNIQEALNQISEKFNVKWDE